MWFNYKDRHNVLRDIIPECDCSPLVTSQNSSDKVVLIKIYVIRKDNFIWHYHFEYDRRLIVSIPVLYKCFEQLSLTNILIRKEGYLDTVTYSILIVKYYIVIFNFFLCQIVDSWIKIKIWLYSFLFFWLILNFFVASRLKLEYRKSVKRLVDSFRHSIKSNTILVTYCFTTIYNNDS